MKNFNEFQIEGSEAKEVNGGLFGIALRIGFWAARAIAKREAKKWFFGLF